MALRLLTVTLSLSVASADGPLDASTDASPTFPFVESIFSSARSVFSTPPPAEDTTQGRLLAEEAKPKRKFCNTTTYALKGDYAYEACGAFCKQVKAANHCKFCKCKSCGFCKTAASATSASSSSAVPPAKLARKAGKKMGKASGKGVGKAAKKKAKKAERKRKLLEA